MRKVSHFFNLVFVPAVFFLSLLAFTSQAQQTVKNRIPTLTVQNGDSKLELKISELKIDIVTTGNIATTTFEILFYNPLPRQLEGEFNFPLAEGQNISRYALEVNGNMREGVVVEKKLARQAFENTTRRNIDPGLVEKTKGNNYKTRIFPIPAKGYKRVLIAFDESLRALGEDLLYTLPMNYSNPINKFEVNVKVLNQNKNPFVDKSALSTLKFKRWENGYVAQLHETDFVLDKNIAFNIPSNSKESYTYYTELYNGKTYFYLNTKYNKQKKLKPNPGSIAVYWDISSSANNRDLDKELSILEAYLNNLDKTAIIEVIPFNIKKGMSKKFYISDGSFTNILNYIKSFKYDGGTQLGALDFSNLNCDEILIFTDGLSTFGEEEIKLSDIPVYALSSSSSANHSYLKQIALSTNGKYINLTELTKEESLDELLYFHTGLISVDFDKNQIEEVYKSLNNESNYVSLVGILKTPNAEIKLNFGYGNNPLESKKITISKNASSSEANIKRIWAQYKISHLDLQFDKNKDLITSLGKEFSVVTGNTSLLVLDRIQDYVQYEITPPEELQKEYFSLLKSRQIVQEERKFTKFNQAISCLKLTEAWWEKEYDQTKPVIKATNRNTDSPVEDDSLYLTGQSSIVPPVPVQDMMIIYEDTEADMDSEMEIVSFVEEEEEFADEPVFMIVERNSTKEIAETEVFGVPNTNAENIRARDTKTRIKPALWEPDAEYLKELKETENNRLEEKYYALKDKYNNQPSFYIDVAHFMFEKGHKDFAIQIISNVCELDLENPELLRIVGYFLLQKGELGLAINSFSEVLKIREEEPQSYRDLALAYAENGQYQEAVDLLYKLITEVGNDRFLSITGIILNELNNIIALHGDKLDLSKIDKRLISNLPTDIRIVINWSSNNTDVDLLVVDPYSEECSYRNKETRIGGGISNDLTQGYGPEEFCLKNAIHGVYKIKVSYFSNNRQSISGPITVNAELFTNYGKPNQKRERISVRLSNAKEIIEIGELVF